MRYRQPLMFPVAVDRDLALPLWEQLADQLRAAVDGLPTGTPMPSTRTLATLAGVSRGVAVAAYDVLTRRGYLTSRGGAGSFVARAGAGVPRPVAPAILDLRPGRLSGAAVPLAAWRAAWRAASFRAPPTAPPPPLGLPELRRAIGAHVQRTYGIPLSDRVVVVTAGAGAGLRAVLDALEVSGREVALCEPAPPELWRPLGRPRALPADRVPDGCRVVVASPDPYPPLGVPLDAAGRALIGGWGGRVVEFAWDAALPVDGYRPPRLGGDILVGGFGELLTPALGIGYAVVPRDLAGPLRSRIAPPSSVSQHALALLLDGGTVDRVRHRHSRDSAGIVVDALGVEPRAGVAVLPLPGRDADVVAAQLRDQRVRVATLAPYHFSGTAVPPALVIGYRHLSEPALRYALRVVAGVYLEGRDDESRGRGASAYCAAVGR